MIDLSVSLLNSTATALTFFSIDGKVGCLRSNDFLLITAVAIDMMTETTLHSLPYQI